MSPITSSSRTQQSKARNGRLAVSKQEAAALLGVSVRFFDVHVRHEVKVAYVGRRRLYPVAGLEEWLRVRSITPQTVGGGHRGA
jgi:hypothetical protein